MTSPNTLRVLLFFTAILSLACDDHSMDEFRGDAPNYRICKSTTTGDLVKSMICGEGHEHACWPGTVEPEPAGSVYCYSGPAGTCMVLAEGEPQHVGTEFVCDLDCAIGSSQCIGSTDPQMACASDDDVYLDTDLSCSDGYEAVCGVGTFLQDGGGSVCCEPVGGEDNCEIVDFGEPCPVATLWHVCDTL
jgi:hypothetical protein